MKNVNLKSLQRRGETPNVPRDSRDVGRVSAGAWSTPLWTHALPAWRGSVRSVDLMGHAELAGRHEAVRRWRGLPADTED